MDGDSRRRSRKRTGDKSSGSATGTTGMRNRAANGASRRFSDGRVLWERRGPGRSGGGAAAYQAQRQEGQMDEI